MCTRLQRSRNLAFHRQAGKCFYCGVTMDPPGTLPLSCTAEHLQARSEGGGDGPNNIVAACAHCNMARHRRKRPLAPNAYREVVQRRVLRGAWHSRSVYDRRLIAV